MIQPWNWKTLAPWKKSYDKPRQHIIKQRHHFADKGSSSQSYDFSSSHVWMSDFNYKESWASQNWCFWTVMLEKTLEHTLDCKLIKAGNPKGNQSWTFIRWTDAKDYSPILWPSESENWLFAEDPYPEKGERYRKGNDGRWDGWIASPTQWTWIWACSGSLWCTGKPGVLQCMGSQRVRHDWETELPQ